MPLTQRLVARNWNLAISGLALTASSVANRVAVSTPLRTGLSVVVIGLLLGGWWCWLSGRPSDGSVPFPGTFPHVATARGCGGLPRGKPPGKATVGSCDPRRSRERSHRPCPSSTPPTLSPRCRADEPRRSRRGRRDGALRARLRAVRPGDRRRQWPRAAIRLAGWSGSWLIYGGSAHLAVLRSLDAGLLVAVVTGLLINARLLVYSASLARRWHDQPRWFRVVARRAHHRPDVGGSRAPRRRRCIRRRPATVLPGAGVVLGVGWSTLIAVGCGRRRAPRCRRPRGGRAAVPGRPGRSGVA